MDLLLYSDTIMGQADSDGLRRFFRGSWGLEDGGRYLYRVYITKRAFNLNNFYYLAEQAYLSPSEKSLLKEIRERTFITQTALWSYADQLVDEYLQAGKFPSILIIDELVAYGHAITEVMQTLERLVKRALLRQRPDCTELEERRMCSALLNAVDIHVYAKSKDGLLLKTSYRNRLVSDVTMSSSEWKNFVQNNSRLLQMFSSNTSYMPAIYMSSRDYTNLVRPLKETQNEENPEWKNSTWIYRSIEEEIWQKEIPGSSSELQHLDLAISCRRDKLSKQYILVPHVFFGDTSSDGANKFCRLVLKSWINTYDKQRTSHITEILSCEYEEFLCAKMQLILYMLSIITLKEFISKDISEQITVECREKSAQNFGKIKSMSTELEKFEALSDSVQNALFAYINEYTSPYQLGKELISEQLSKDICISDMERCLSRAAAKDEAHIAAIRKAKAVYDSETRFLNVISLNEFLSDRTWKDETVSHKLAVIVLMADANIISINPHYTLNGISIGLKLGELSKLLKIRRMYRFMPALLELENYCCLYGYDMVQMSRRFGTYLERRESGKHYTELFRNFVDEIYSCGGMLKDWSVNTLIDLDKPSKSPAVRIRQEWSNDDWGDEWNKIEDKAQTQYIGWELTRQMDYRQALADFLEIKQPRR